MSKVKNRPTIEIKYEVFKEDYLKYSAYMFFIHKLMEKGEKIPARVLKKYFSFFSMSGEEKAAQQEWRIKETYKTILPTLIKTKYSFSGSKLFKGDPVFTPPPLIDEIENSERELQREPTKIPFSLENLLLRVIEKSITIIENDKIADRDEIIRIIYSQIVVYKRLNLNQTHKVFLTPYKMGVITATITSALGYTLGKKKATTNHELFQSVRHAIEKCSKA